MRLRIPRSSVSKLETRRVSAYFHSVSEGLRNRRADRISSLLSAEHQQPSLCSQAEIVLSYSVFFFYPGLQLMEQGPYTLGKATCCIWFTDPHVNSVNPVQKHSHRHIVWALHGPVKLTHKINFKFYLLHTRHYSKHFA